MKQSRIEHRIGFKLKNLLYEFCNKNQVNMTQITYWNMEENLKKFQHNQVKELKTYFNKIKSKEDSRELLADLFMVNNFKKRILHLCWNDFKNNNNFLDIKNMKPKIKAILNDANKIYKCMKPENQKLVKKDIKWLNQFPKELEKKFNPKEIETKQEYIKRFVKK